MSKLNLKDLKKRLETERELLIEKLNGTDLSVDDSETPDPVDLAVRNYSKNVSLAVSENDSRQLTEMENHLHDAWFFGIRTGHTVMVETKMGQTDPRPVILEMQDEFVRLSASLAAYHRHGRGHAAALPHRAHA